MALTDDQFDALLTRIDENNLALKAVVKTLNKMFNVLEYTGLLNSKLFNGIAQKAQYDALVAQYGQAQINTWIAEVQTTFKPIIVDALVAFDNSYIDIFLSEGVYGDVSASTPIAKNNLEYFFNKNGSLINVTPGSVTLTKRDGSSLVGGEHEIRLNFVLTGTVIGVENVEIRFKENEVFNGVGNAGEINQTTGRIFLYVQ